MCRTYASPSHTNLSMNRGAEHTKSAQVTEFGNLNSGRLGDISKIIAPGKLPIIQYKVTQYLGTTNWFGRMILKRHKIGWVDSGVN